MLLQIVLHLAANAILSCSSQSVSVSLSSQGSRTVGSTVVIDCLVRGPPTTSVTRLKDSVPLESTDRVLLTEESGPDGTNFRITITSLSSADNGIYTCLVENGGSVSRSSTGIFVGGGGGISISSSSSGSSVSTGSGGSFVSSVSTGSGGSFVSSGSTGSGGSTRIFGSPRSSSAPDLSSVINTAVSGFIANLNRRLQDIFRDRFPKSFQ